MRIGEGKAVLQVTARMSEFDADGDIILCTCQMNLSVRAYTGILKLSRTIAELTGIEEIQSQHMAEALQYHPKIMM